MLTALYQTKKARFLKSDAFRQLQAGKQPKSQIVEEVVTADVEKAKRVYNVCTEDIQKMILMTTYSMRCLKHFL